MKSVTEYLDRSAERFPDKIAFGDDRRTITFSELRDEGVRIGTALIQKGLFRKPVVVFMDRCPEAVSCIAGVLYSGCFYCALDITMPAERLRHIMNTLGPALILTDGAHRALTDSFAGETEIALYEELLNTKADAAMLHTVWTNLLDSDLIYTVFTSGSTGIPKGVATSHRAVLRYTEWGSSVYSIDEHSVFGNSEAFYFVASIFDLFQTWRSGCTTWLLSKMCLSFPMMLMSTLQEKKVTCLALVPSVLITLANLGALEALHLDHLKTIIFGGEMMPIHQLNQWRAEYPNLMLVNVYGSTESTDGGIYYVLDRPISENEVLPIGKAADYAEVLLLDEQGKPVPDGEIGELYLRSETLAFGYYNNPEKTAEVFVQNPQNTAYPEKIYRTGDMAFVNGYGELVCVGRRDFQIKHMGYRIELGEIETAVSSQPGVERCCCLYDGEKDLIVLFYTGATESSVVLDGLKTLLPDYMIPNHTEHLEQMPFNSNGKVDRQALKERMT